MGKSHFSICVPASQKRETRCTKIEDIQYRCSKQKEELSRKGVSLFYRKNAVSTTNQSNHANGQEPSAIEERVCSIIFLISQREEAKQTTLYSSARSFTENPLVTSRNGHVTVKRNGIRGPMQPSSVEFTKNKRQNALVSAVQCLMSLLVNSI